MVKIWEREGFSALVDAIKVNREEQKKVTNYTSTFMSTANKNNVTKPPALPQKTFDWQSIIKKAQEKKVDPRSDDRKQAQLANQEIAAHQAQTQRNIEAESGRWTKAYEQSKIKEAEEDMLASTMSFDAELKPGDKLYLDWESNTVTNKPTNMELYKVEDTYVPIYRNAAGQLSFPEGMPVVDLSKVKDAKYTPDIEIYLRGEVDKFDTTRPQTLAPEIVPNNQQLYFDRVLNQVVDYETQTPLYWDQFTGQMTEQETENPVAANEETLTYLGENFKSYQDTYASFEALGQLGMPADPNAVGITPQVTRENVLEGSKIWTMTTGEAEQNTVYPDPTTNQPMLLERQNPAFQLSSFLANIPWFNGKTIGDTLGGKTAGLLNAGINWIMTGGNLPKQYTFGQQSTFMNKPILGISPITAMSYVAAGVTLGWNSVMSLFRQVGYTFSGQMTYKENVENSFDNFYKKIEIARRNAQLDKIEMAYNSGRTMQEIIGEAANQNIEYRTQLNNLQEGRAENLNPMQIAALTDDLESKVIKQQSYIDLLLQLQRETVGKSQVQFDYANKLIDSGHPNLGAASMASGLESFYAGADFNLMRQYLNSSPTQRANFVIPAGQEVFFAGIEGMSAKELTEFENFVRHNELGFDLYPEAYISGETFKFYEGGDKVINLQKPATGKDFSQMWMGANRLFLYDVAEQVTKTGVEMTPVEMLDYLKETWLPNFFASAEENPGHNRYIEKEIELTQQFSDLSFSQMSISNMYLEAAAGFTTGSPEHAAFMQLSNNFREEAFYNYIENVIPHHIRSGILNPYAAWSYGMDSELDAKFKKAIATASFQLGRLLSEPEITQLSYMYQDPAMELFGEVFLDLNNFILPAVGGITKSAGKNIVVPAVKKIPGVAKALDGLANAGFVKLFTGQSLQTVATKQGQSATDLLLVVLQTKPATKEEFIKQVSDIATFAKKVTTITDNITEEVAKLADSTVFKGNVPPRIQKEILDLARTIDPDEWIKLADNAWDKVKLGYTESFTKQVLKENPGKSMADDVVRNAINHKVEQRMGNFFGAERLASTIAENFRETSLKQNMTKLGSKLVMNDSISGAIAKKYGDTALGRMLGGLLELQSKYMRMWVWATLARRPAWMIFNFTDNMFRYVMSSLFEGSRFIDDMKGIGDMLSKEGVPEYIMETGIVPPKKAQASFFSDVFQGTSEVEKLALENVNLSANPFSFATHWLNLYRHNAVGRGFFGKIWGGFQAWPMGIRSLNNAIETGMKTRMYLKFYERNIAKLNHTAVADILGTLAKTLEEKGVSPEMAKTLENHVLNAWSSSGGNAAKLHDLLKFDRLDPKLSGYNIFIPESLRKAEWFDEVTQSQFIYGISERFIDFQNSLTKQGIKELEPKHVDQFFDEMLRVFESETQARVQALKQNYDIIMGTDIGTGHEQYKAARYSKAIDNEIKDVTPEARKFLSGFDNTKPMSAKQKKALKNHLTKNGIDFEDTEEGLKAGYESLMRKMNEYESTKPTVMKDVDIAEAIKEVDPSAPPISQTELNAAEARVLSDRPTTEDIWKQRATTEAQVHNLVETGIDDIEALKSFSDSDKVMIANNVKGIVSEVNNLSARISRFWRETFPGPLAGKSGIDYKTAVGNRWDSYDRRMIYQLENRIAHMNSDIVAAINAGTFKPGTDITAEEILRLSGVDLFYNESGEILAVRMLNPATGTVQEIDHPMLVKDFKAKLGINDQADATRPRVADYLKAEGKAIPDPDYLQQLAFKLRVPQMPSLDEMIKLDPRLDLAIREKDWKSANIILAEKFQFKMRSKAGANLDQLLVNKVKKHAGLKDVKKLSEINPRDTYRVLDDWFKSSSGITLNGIEAELRPQFISALENMFNIPRPLIEDMMRIVEGLGGTIRGGIEGKSALEAWGEVLVGIYKSDVGGGSDIVRATDSMMLFNSKVREIVKNTVGNATKPSDLLKTLTNQMGLERVKLLQLDTFLKGKRKITSETLLKHLDGVERFISAKPTGNNYAWAIDLMDHGSTVKVSMNADLLARDIDDVTKYGLKVTSQVGELDEMSKQRLLYWAGENQYSFVEYLDGTIDNVVARDFMMAEGTYGVTQFVKDEVAKQQAIIKAMSGANAATALEEFFHAAKPFMPQSMIDELDDWAGKLADDLMKKNPDKGWSKYQWVEEIEAKGFQKTIITKLDAPKNIQEIFNNLRNTLVAIYRKWKDFFEGITIPKNVEDVYVRMLDKDYVAKQVKDVPKPKNPKPTQGTLFQRTGDDVWKLPDQEITSARTSIKCAEGKLPATFKSVDFVSGTRNADIGGGAYDFATDYLKGKNVENIIYDPFNRTMQENLDAIAKIQGGQSDTATINNVLNVIKEPENRELVIRQAMDAIKPDGKAYFLMYEGNGSGLGKITSAGWQENRKAATYIDEISKYFGEVTRKGNLITASSPKKYTNLFQKVDKLTNPKEWGEEMLRVVDSLFVDLDTNLYKALPVRKSYYLSITPSTFDYVSRTFGLEETKSYLQQIAEVLYDVSNGIPVATPKPGVFVVGFDTIGELDSYARILKDAEIKTVAQVFNEGEVWSITPKFVTNSSMTLEDALEGITQQLDRYLDELGNQWKLENAIDAPYALEDLMELNEAALYPEIRKGIVEQPLGTQRPNLLMVHSVDEYKLRNALDLGGMPSISGAVIKKDMNVPDYGSIVFIGNKNMVDPMMNPANRTFSADIFSPRKPAATEIRVYDIPTEANQTMDTMMYVADVVGDTGLKNEIAVWQKNPELFDANRYDYLRQGSVGQTAFLIQKHPELISPEEYVNGIKLQNLFSDGELREEFYSWLGPNNVTRYDVQRVLTIDGKKVPFTVENVGEWMKSQIKKGGEFAGSGTPKPYSAQTAKALGAREFASLDDMRKFGKTNLQTEQFMRKYIDEYQTPTLNALENNLTNFIFSVGSYKENTPHQMFGILSAYNDGRTKTKQSMIDLMRNYIKKEEYSSISIDEIPVGTTATGKELTEYKVHFWSTGRSWPYAKTFDSKSEADRFVKELHELNKPIQIPDDLVEQAMNAAKILDFTPTSYFEFKPDRVIDFSEWSGVVMPYNTSKDIIDALEARGLEVKFYGAYTGNTKDSVIESFFSKENVLFQRAKENTKDEVNEAWKAFVQSPIFDYGNDKVSLKDMWLVFFENEDTLYKAGNKGFKSYAMRVATQLEDAGNMELSEVFRGLADLSDNFASYIEKNVLRVDPLFPKTITGSPMPLWKMNEALRNYVSNKYMVGSEWMKSRKALEMWRDELKNNLNGSLIAQTEITPEVREVLNTVADYGFNVKNQVDEVANYGGTYKDITIDPSEGAVKKTNFIMMDYSDNSTFLQALKQVFPFISYPAKSVGYWVDLMSSHPELVTFYYKYQKFSDSVAIQNGAVTSNGEVLPSLEGYLPIMEGLWFNPLAPLVYRFAFPRVQNLTESSELEGMTPVQKVASFLLNDAPVLGFNLGPIPTQILMTQVDPNYPKAPWWYEGIRAYFPIDYIPPIWERFIVEKLRQVGFKSSVFPGDVMMPRVSWQDYLIERELLSDALLKLDTMEDDREKLEYAKTIKALLGNPDRDENELWVQTRNNLETDQYWRTMSGHMTGLYTKPFTDGQARLQELRDEINILKASIEDQTLANLFGMSGEAGQRYEDYKDFKFETPDGYMWSAIQMSRYVTDPETGQPLIGEERRKRMEEIYNTEEQTSMYFTAIKEAKARYEEKLSGLPVGDWELRRTIKEEYVTELNAINDSKLYLLANKDSFLGYKPNVRIYNDMQDRFWYQILATKPSRNPSEDYEDYERRVQEWEEEIPEFAEITLPLLEMSIVNQITESQIKLEDRLGQVPVWMAQLKQQANLDGFNAWSNSNATSLDAVWNYWEKEVIQPYLDELKGKDMYESKAYKMQWEREFREPSKEEIIAWVQKTYGRTQFTEEEIIAEIEGKGYIKPEDRLQSGKNDVEKSMDEVWTIRASLGPAVSSEYKSFMETFYSLGGTEDDWDRFFYAKGDIGMYQDVEEYTEFLRKVKLAFIKGDFEPVTEEQLIQFSAVKKDQDEFSDLVEKTLGSNIWNLMSDYYGLNTSERKTYRTENQDDYYKIQQYYVMKDEYAVNNPIWASYYHPDFEASTGSEATVTSGGGYSSTGGYYSGYSGKGYSATYSEYKASPYANAFLPQGKRGARTGMELLVYGLGRGGVTRQPWWPKELLAQLHEQMVQQIQTGNITPAGIQYLNSVAESNPAYSKIIRDNLKAIKAMRGGPNEYQQKNTILRE